MPSASLYVHRMFDTTPSSRVSCGAGHPTKIHQAEFTTLQKSAAGCMTKAFLMTGPAQVFFLSFALQETRENPTSCDGQLCIIFFTVFFVHFF